MLMKARNLFIVLCVCSLASPAFAQEDASSDDGKNEKSDDKATTAELTKEAREAMAFQTVPDRPTFSAAAHTVEQGHAQLEVGGEFAASGELSTLSFPVLARIGIAESFELRAGLPSFIVPLSGDADPALGSLQLGAKVAGAVTEKLSLGALPYFDIATSVDDDQTSFSQSTYGALLLWGFSFSDSFGIGGNLGAAVGPSSDPRLGPRELFWAGSLTAGVAFGDLGVTAEGFTVAGEFDDATGGGSLSLSYALFEKLVLDAYGGGSVQGESTNVFGGLGATFAR